MSSPASTPSPTRRPEPSQPRARRRTVPRPRVLAAMVLAWTLVSWGGRIQLITAPEAGDPWALVRIGGSLLLGVATAGVLWRAPGRAPGRAQGRATVLRWVFVGWTLALWGRSLVVTWLDPPSVAFGVVHTVLAAGWLWLAWAVAPDPASADDA